MKRNFILFMMIISLTSVGLSAFAQKSFNVTSGTWNTPGNWNPSGVPGSGDAVTIPEGRTVTVDVAAVCASLTFTAGSTASSISINSGQSISMSGTLTFTNPVSGSGDQSIAVGQGSLTCGALTFNNTSNNTELNALTITSGSLTVNGVITMPGAVGENTLSVTTGTISTTSNPSITQLGNLSLGTGSTFNYSGAAQNILATTYSNLRVSGSGTKTVTADLTVNDILIISSGATLDMVSFTLLGTDSTSGTGTLKTQETIATPLPSGIRWIFDVDYNRGGNQTIVAGIYNNLLLTISGTKTLSSSISVDGNFTLSGTAVTTTVAALTIQGNLSVGDGTTFTAAGFALTVNGSTTVGAGTSGIFTISSATGTKAFNGDLTVNAGATWNNTAANAGLTLPGSISNAGTFNAGSGTHTLTGSTKTIGGTFSIANITVNGTYTNNGTLTATATLNGSGTLTNGATGTLNIGFTGTMGLTNLVASASGNTVDYQFGGTQTAKAITYHHLKLSTSGTKTITGISTVNGDFTMSGTAAATPSTAMTIIGDVILSGTATFTGGAFTHEVRGDWTNNGGTFTSTGTTINFTTSSSAINGTAASQTFNIITLNKTAGQTLSVSGSTTSLTIGGTYTQTTGNFTAPATMVHTGAVTLTAGTYTAGTNISVATTWTNNGATFTPGSGTVTFIGSSSAINGSAATQTFNNIIVNKTAGQTLSVSGTFQHIGILSLEFHVDKLSRPLL